MKYFQNSIINTYFDEIKDILKQLVISQKDTEIKFKETDAKFKKLHRQFSDTGLSNGEAWESFFIIHWKIKKCWAM
jgi:hypothetical protein